MNNNQEWPVYFIALGPVTGNAIGIILSLFFRSVNMAFWISGGATAGLLIGVILYSVYQNEDNEKG